MFGSWGVKFGVIFFLKHPKLNTENPTYMFLKTNRSSLLMDIHLHRQKFRKPSYFLGIPRSTKVHQDHYFGSSVAGTPLCMSGVLSWDFFASRPGVEQLSPSPW